MAYGGIYRIKNKVNGKFYIGSSDNINRRFRRHLLDLNKNKHDNQHLQHSWNKYGKDVFVLEVIKECKNEELLIEEQKELDVWVGNVLCYNMRKDAKCPVAIGEKRPQWVIDKISKSQKGRARWTDEQRKQMSIDRKGRKHKPETIVKFMNRKSSYENIRKAQLSNIGRIYSENHKHNISIGKLVSNTENIGI